MKPHLLVYLPVLVAFCSSGMIAQSGWYPQETGTDNHLYAVSFADTDNGVAVGDMAIILRTTNGGTNWVNPGDDSSSQESLLRPVLTGVSLRDAQRGTAVGGIVWLAGMNAYADNTTNGGATWSFQSLSTAPFSDVAYGDSNTLTAVGGFSLFGVGGNIYRSTDGGTTWTVQLNVEDTLFSAVSFTDANTGTVVGGAAIIRTTDGGASWTNQTSGTPYGLQGVCFSDANTGTVVGEAGTILRTTNGGTTWTSQQSGTSNNLYDVSFIDASTGTAVGWGGTIVRTTNGGATWTSQSSGTMQNLWGVCLINARIGWAVGDSGTVLRTSTGGVTGLDGGSGTELPQNYLLCQNYPNPFNPTTAIRFRITDYGFVSLRIYDVLGREVARLANEVREPGIYTARWDADGFASGAYFYRLRAGDFVQTKRMMVVK